MFSSDIAYSRSPAASRAASRSANVSQRRERLVSTAGRRNACDRVLRGREVDRSHRACGGKEWWVTVRRYEGVTNPDEAAKRVREGFVPLISDHRGFVAYYWMDAGDGVMFSTSVFEDQADEEDSNRLAADWVKANIADLLPNPPVITAGHVVAQS
jgi:hypothetical protein